MDYTYLLIDHCWKKEDECTVVRYNRTTPFQTYNYLVDAWEDEHQRLAGILIGSPDSDPITEEEAREIITRHGGNFTTD